MKLAKKTIVIITVAGVLTGSALAALAGSTNGKPFEGVVVQDVVVMDQFPNEVQSGSIQTKDDSEQAMAAKSKLSSNEAADVAAKAVPGKVVETQLGDENGYLIWEVETIGNNGQDAQLKIDAGNGRLLAIKTGDNDKRHEKGEHGSWKFWEDHDRDENHTEQK